VPSSRRLVGSTGGRSAAPGYSGAVLNPAGPAPPPRILLAEDDPAIARTTGYALQREGMAVTHVLLAGEAQALLQRGGHDLLLLDLGLPDGNGIDLCRRLRQAPQARLRSLPVLMLTARAEEIDRVLGLEMGADDYLTKPFSPRELVARVRALLRRAALSPPVPEPAGDWVLDTAGQRIRYAGSWLTLTRLEYQLLRTLLAAPTHIHSRAALFSALWGDASGASERVVDTHVKTLRAKLRSVTPAHDPIATHRGLGYGLQHTG